MSLISDERFLRNVTDARDNGYDLVCARCGVGMTDDEFEGPDAHEMDARTRAATATPR